jgi:hypothetical protein
MKKINIELVVGSWTFDVDDLWPDGNAPEKITGDAVMDLIEKEGGLVQALEAWNLADDIDVDILIWEEPEDK